MPDPTPRPPLFTRIFPLLILAAVVALFFAPALFFGKVYFLRDLSMEIVPKRQFWADHHGLVLWNPEVFAGEPYAANPQSSAFYPLSLLWLLGPAEVVLGSYLALHFMLAGILSYFLFLELGLRRSSAVAGALAFALGGGFASLSLLVVNLNSAAWLPGIFWMGIRTQQTKSWRAPLILGIFFGLQILAGEPEICYLTFLLLMAYLLFRSLAEKNSAGAGIGRTLPRLLAALLIGLGLSAIQWILTLEMTGLSNRGQGMSLDQAVAYSLEARDLISILIPHYFLEPSSNLWGFGFWSQELPFLLSIYPGIIAVLLLPFALGGRRRGEAVFWTALALLSLLIALGPAGHLYAWMHRWLPGFNRFRMPERTLLVFAWAWAWLTALGVEALPHRLRDLETSLRGRLSAVLLFAGAVILLYLALMPLYETADPGGYLFYRSTLRSLLFADLFLLVLLAPSAIQLASRPGQISLLPTPQRFLTAGVTLLLAADLFSAHRLLNPWTDRSFYTRRLAPTSELLRSSNPWPVRAVVYGPARKQDWFLGRDESPLEFYRTERELLLPFWALRYGIGDLQAHSSFYLALQEDLLTLALRSGSDQYARLIWLCGVEKLAAPEPGVKPLANPLPRAYLAFAERRARDHAQAKNLLLSEGFDLSREVIIEGESESVPFAESRPLQAVKVVGYENERVEAATEAEQPAWLVLVDTDYPGWRVWVDGKESAVRRANGYFRAVRLPAGRHRVAFVYQPTHWRLACGLTMGTALLVGLLWLIPKRVRQEDSR